MDMNNHARVLKLLKLVTWFSKGPYLQFSNCSLATCYMDITDTNKDNYTIG